MRKMKREKREVDVMTVLADGGMGEGLVPTTEKNVVLFYSNESGALDQTNGLVITGLRV